MSTTVPHEPWLSTAHENSGVISSRVPHEPWLSTAHENSGVISSRVSHPLPSAQAQAIAELTGYEDAATLRWQQACVQAANTLTALPNGRYVSVRMERMRQGLELAQRGAVSLPDDGEQLSAVVRSGHNLYQDLW